jgi:hypothetical protein
MNARGLLQSLKNQLEIESPWRDDRPLMLIKNEGPLSEAIVSVQVEGKIKLIKIVAIDLGVCEAEEQESMSVDQ